MFTRTRAGLWRGCDDSPDLSTLAPGPDVLTPGVACAGGLAGWGSGRSCAAEGIPAIRPSEIVGWNTPVAPAAIVAVHRAYHVFRGPAGGSATARIRQSTAMH